MTDVGETAKMSTQTSKLALAKGRSCLPPAPMKEIVLQEEFESDQHATIIANNIARLRSGQYSDFVVTAGTNKKKNFQCHKIILIVSSEFFRSVIGSLQSLTIKEIEPEEFEGILDYIYKGKILLTTLNVGRILHAAHFLQLEDLKRGCVNFLLKTLEPENCMRYWHMAHVNDLPRLWEACRALTAREFYRVTATPELLDLPYPVMQAILSDDMLDVQTEVDVIEMALRWMDNQNTEEKGYDLSLFQLFRWSGVSDTYVRRRLMEDPKVSNNANLKQYLSRVLDYLAGGAQCSDIVTIHRILTGLEKSVFIIGVITPTLVCPDVIKISLQRSEALVREQIQTIMRREAAACVCPRTNTIYVSGLGQDYDEIWQWTGVAGWNMCERLNCGRRRHCMVFATETAVFIIGGYAGQQYGMMTSIEKYDTRRETCLIVGDLVFPVDSAAAIADYNSIYVFGGSDCEGNPVNHVQIFDITKNCSTLLVHPLPRPMKLLRAVVFNRMVIIVSLESCILFDLDKQLWSPRHQFRSGRIHFGCVVENQRLYLFGGGNNVRDPSTQKYDWILSDQIRHVPVQDIIDDKPAQWSGLDCYKLPTPCLVQAYAAVTTTTGCRRLP